MQQCKACCFCELLEVCQYNAGTDFKVKSRCLSYFCCFISICCELKACQPSIPNTETCVIYLTQELLAVGCFVLHQTNLDLLNGRLKCVNTVSSQRFLQLSFTGFCKIRLVRLIGYKGGINTIQPGGGVYLAGKVIDLLQDLGLPPPQSTERLIFPLQMENKLPFKHMKTEENDWEGKGSLILTAREG